MYDLLEYSKNYRKTTGSLWSYCRDEPNSGINNGIAYSIMGSKSFDYKANFIEDGVTHNNLTKNHFKIVVPLKHLSKFWRSLNIPLINCKVELILTWFKNCVLISKATREANYSGIPVVYEIDPTFTNGNRLFVSSFPRNNNTDGRYSYSNYYVPKVEINDFNVLIDGKLSLICQ